MIATYARCSPHVSKSPTMTSIGSPLYGASSALRIPRLIDSSRSDAEFVSHPFVPRVPRDLHRRSRVGRVCVADCRARAERVQSVQSGSKNFAGRVAGETQRWKAELGTDEPLFRERSEEFLL